MTMEQAVIFAAILLAVLVIVVRDDHEKNEDGDPWR